VRVLSSYAAPSRNARPWPSLLNAGHWLALDTVDAAREAARPAGLPVTCSQLMKSRASARVA
jgi:hypothetical protein